MHACTGDLIRLYNEADYHEVIGTVSKGYRFSMYRLSDGRVVSFARIESVVTDEVSDLQAE